MSSTVWGTPNVLARVTLVAVPVIAFRTFPLPGLVTLALLVPAVLLAAAYATTSGARLPLWELLIIAVLAVSVLWGDDPAYSTERLRTYVPLLLATTIAGCLVTGETVMKCLRLAFAVIVGSSILVLLVDPVTRYRMPGSSSIALGAQFDKNTYGGLLLFALILVLAERQRGNVVLIPVLLVLIAFNRSVTVWGVALFLVCAMLACRYVVSRFGVRTSMPVLVIGGVAGVAFSLVLGQVESSSVLAVVGKDPTLSDRTAIWAASWEQVKSAPWLGHGAFTFLNSASNSPVTQLVRAQFQNYQPPHPHNGVLDLWGQIGLLGVAVYCGLVILGLRRSVAGALLGAKPAVAALMGLTFILLYGLTEPAYLGPWLVISIMCLAMPNTASVVRHAGAVTLKPQSPPPELSI